MGTLSLKDLHWLLETGDPYPFYAILLYPPLNGLSAKLHKYVESHWGYLNGLTGNNCLLLALERAGGPAEEFRPEDVYAIARYLGATVDKVPCIIFITDPKHERQTLVQPLSMLFTDSEQVTDDDFTEFFQGVQALIDRCVDQASDDNRFECLHGAFDREYVLPTKGRRAVVIVTAVAGTVMQVLQPITALLSLVR